MQICFFLVFFQNSGNMLIKRQMFKGTYYFLLILPSLRKMVDGWKPSCSPGESHHANKGPVTSIKRQDMPSGSCHLLE